MRIFWLIALLLALLMLPPASGPARASIGAQAPALAIDVGTDGNSADSVGEIQDCISVAAGDRFRADVVITEVTDLLAWEVHLDYNPTVLTVVDQDVKLFLGGNEGSSPVDLSARLPDDSGFHSLSAFESSDPPTPDSGSGVLARVTLQASAEGETELAFGDRDLNADGALDRGTLLKDIDAVPIGDESGDDFFDGETSDAIVVVGQDCPGGTNAVEPDTSTGSSGTSIWIYMAGVVGLIAFVTGIAAVLIRRRRAVDDM